MAFMDMCNIVSNSSRGYRSLVPMRMGFPAVLSLRISLIEVIGFNLSIKSYGFIRRSCLFVGYVVLGLTLGYTQHLQNSVNLIVFFKVLKLFEKSRRQ